MEASAPQSDAPTVPTSSQEEDENSASTLPTTSTVITDLPFDLICKIFDLLNLGTAACFGLVNTQLYAYLKTCRPKPISLKHIVCDSQCRNSEQTNVGSHHVANCHTILAQRLERSDLTRGYTLRRIPLWGNSRTHQWLLLNKEIYTDDTKDCCGEGSCDHKTREMLLFKRYKDWNKSFNVLYPGWDSPPYGGRRTEVVPHLPSPFDMGNDWYDQAWEVVRVDVSALGDSEVWRLFWRYWRKFHFVKQDIERLNRIIDDRLWEMWLEGFVGLGFRDCNNGGGLADQGISGVAGGT